MIKVGDEVVCMKNFENVYLPNEIYIIDGLNVKCAFIAERNHYGRYGFGIDNRV